MATAWTSREEKFLRDNIDVLELSELAKLLNKTKCAVGYRARKLGLKGKQPEELHLKGKAGFWHVGGATSTIISMCIKEDFEQTITQLAERVATTKNVDFDAVLEQLVEMKLRGQLGFYDEFYRLVKWVPGKGKL